jgi:hypothetical protein
VTRADVVAMARMIPHAVLTLEVILVFVTWWLITAAETVAQ